jgi:CelD/BcsL family acetyltransferase involved in cellulose biosynthesis
VKQIEDSLHKSGNKSRLRQLKKMGGPVELVRVTDPAEFIKRDLDQVIAWNDERSLAAYGIAPFAADPLKRAFHQAMLHEPELLHTTLLKVGPKIASVHLNVRKGTELQMGLIAHNPEFEKHSPGKLHILFLCRMMAAEGFTQLDLTPGGDAYKERFANAHEQVQSLTCFASAGRRRMAAMLSAAERSTKSLLCRMHIKPARVAALAAKFTAAGFFAPLITKGTIAR